MSKSRREIELESEVGRQAMVIVDLSSEIMRLRTEASDLKSTIDRLTRDLSAARSVSPTSPSTPSSQVPAFLKPTTSPEKKRRGRKVGHVGVTRKKPEKIDKTTPHTLDCCPHCSRSVSKVRAKDGSHLARSRVVEDIVQAKPLVTEHQIQQYWCTHCKVRVEPCVKAAMPGDRLGLNLVITTAIQHYQFGIATAKIRDMLRTEHGVTVSKGGLHLAWVRLAEHLRDFRNAILENVRTAGALHADETGWRIAGKTNWLWCFGTKSEVLYLIESSRSTEVVLKVLGKGMDGTLIRDFYAPYDAAEPASSQYCLGHFLGEFKKVRNKEPEGINSDFEYFEKRTKEIIQGAIAFAKQQNLTPEMRDAEAKRLRSLLYILTDMHWDHPDAERLAKRLSDRMSGIFTFVEKENVDPTNNWAELLIRSAVLMRKVSYGNQSDRGADAQGNLMSVFKTLALRGKDVHAETRSLVEFSIEERHRAKNKTEELVANTS